MLKGKSLRQIYKYIEFLGIVLTICLLPIDRFPYQHHIPLGLGAISFVLLGLAAGLRFINVIFDKRWTDFKRIVFIGVLLLLPVLAYAQSIHYALDQPLARGATRLLLIVSLKAWCFFVLMYTKPRLWHLVKRTVYVVTALVVAFGFFQFIFDVFGASTSVTDLRACCTSNSTYVFPRVHSVSIEPLYFANFLILPVLMMVRDFAMDKSTRKNKWLLTLFLATSTLFVLSLARSAMLGLGISLVIFAWGLGRARVRTLMPYILRGLGAVVAVALVFVIASGIASRFIHKSAINGSESGVTGNIAIFSSHAVAVADQSAQTRYSTWPKAIGYIKESPLKGVGAYNSRVKLNLPLYRKGVPDTQLQPFNNDFIGLLVDLGLVGIIAFGPVAAALFVSLARSFRTSWASPSTPYTLAALAMIIQSNFFQSILLARLWVVVGIALTGLYIEKTRKVIS